MESERTTAMVRLMRRLRTSERGVSMVEYVLVAALVSSIASAGLSAISGGTGDTFDEAGVALRDPGSVQVISPDLEGDGDEDSDDDADDEDTTDLPTEGTGSSGGGGASGGGDGGDDGAGSGSGGGEVGDGGEATNDASDDAGESGDDDGSDDGDDEAADDGSNDGDGDAAGGTETVAETAGVFAEFSATFVLVDGEVELDDVATSAWTYAVTVDDPNKMVLKFLKPGTGEQMKVRCWITASGSLKSKVVEL
ncbi:Flp family type IVb pilin [Actinomycetota bacterium]